jgi:hypothetical protein
MQSICKSDFMLLFANRNLSLPPLFIKVQETN